LKITILKGGAALLSSSPYFCYSHQTCNMVVNRKGLTLDEFTIRSFGIFHATGGVEPATDIACC